MKLHAAIIRNIRRSLGLSQQQFADKLGLSQGAVAAWETGRTQPSFDVLYRMVHELKVSPNAIFGLDDTPRAQEEK